MDHIFPFNVNPMDSEQVVNYVIACLRDCEDFEKPVRKEQDCFFRQLASEMQAIWEAVPGSKKQETFRLLSTQECVTRVLYPDLKVGSPVPPNFVEALEKGLGHFSLFCGVVDAPYCKWVGTKSR